MSPASKDYDETAHVLKVGGRARGVHRVVATPFCNYAPAGMVGPVGLRTAHRVPAPAPAHLAQYAALATQIGTIQAAEAPRRTIKAVSPAIKKVKRKAALPPEARGQGAK